MINTKESLASMEVAEAINYVAEIIDNATDLGCIEQAILGLDLCDELSKKANGVVQVELCYLRGNAWAAIRDAKHKNEDAIWPWDQPELLHEIYWLRTAICSADFNSLIDFRKCQILVNTANLLSHIGRPIEAIEYWNRALALIPNFGMTLGNLGYGLSSYAKLLYDRGHANVILKHAYDFLYSIKNQSILWEGSEHFYKKVALSMIQAADDIAAHVDIKAIEQLSLDDFSLGKTKSEQAYRRWALDTNLFLNPLNELGGFSIAARDVLHLPSMVGKVGETPYLFGFYNQLKQEYASARYTLWQGLCESKKGKQHFSDKDSLLFDSLDYPIYGLASEQIKLAFRSAYSLLDKMAFFINDYWHLEMQENRVNFQSIWYEYDKNTKKNELRKKFYEYANLPLRGLYWISKDFIEQANNEDIVLASTMEPDADKLRTIRNHLEHKYLKVHDDFWGSDKGKADLAYQLSDKELSEKTLRLFKQVRAALIYLSLAVHREENIRASLNEKDGLVISMQLKEWKKPA